MKKNLEWGKEIIQAASDIASLGVPGVGLIARFAEHFYDTYLRNRFDKFVLDAEIDKKLLLKISENETYSNCFYGILETVRQTHSKIGLIALALIYKEHWNDEVYLIAAMQAFSQISDETINAFILLYESIPEDENYLNLKMQKDDKWHFSSFYNEAVELIRRNFFVMSYGVGIHANGPVQGMKWNHTDSYYTYCKLATTYI